MASEMKFKAGDLVKLKSGSPTMTVEEADYNYHKAWVGTYKCSWFAGAKNNHRSFTEASLEFAEAPK